jgi:hypothetical protein
VAEVAEAAIAMRSHGPTHAAGRVEASLSGLFGAVEPRRSMGSHQSANAGTHTWLTPPGILDALGPFDLDPCACPLPRPWDTAGAMWTREDAPLNREWFGRVWLNPPFGPKPVVSAFMRRMADHGRGTALLFARTETELFFETVWSRATAVLFLKGRPHFHHQDGRRAGANSGAPVVLIAYGERDAALLCCSGLEGRYLPLGPPI